MGGTAVAVFVGSELAMTVGHRVAVAVAVAGGMVSIGGDDVVVGRGVGRSGSEVGPAVGSGVRVAITTTAVGKSAEVAFSVGNSCTGRSATGAPVAS